MNEQDIVDLSKIAQLGQFNDIDNGNLSTAFYGGIVFPKDFDYEASGKAPSMDYKIRFGISYTVADTGTIYNHAAGPGTTG